MLAAYIQTRLVKAEPKVLGKPLDKDYLRSGYQVYYPDGYSEWMAEAEFERKFRRVSREEREILAMTDAEASIAQISDGERPECPNSHDGRHHWIQNLEAAEWRCDFCPAHSFSNPGQL